MNRMDFQDDEVLGEEILTNSSHQNGSYYKGIIGGVQRGVSRSKVP